MKKILIILGIVVVAVAAIFFSQRGTFNSYTPAPDPIEPIDLTLNFYDAWLAAVKSTTTTPYEAGILDGAEMTDELRARLAAGEVSSDIDYGAIDPVLCQTVDPSRISAKTLYVAPGEKAQVQIFTKGAMEQGQAIVTLVPNGPRWTIEDILCSHGEFDIPREFSFDQQGNLLKSVPEPYDSNYWHIVFTQDGTPGYVAPLYFDANSMCVTTDGSESVCSPDTFTEAAKVHVQGEMTELGVNVKRVTFTE